jgi:hypothetical protein
MDAFTQFFVIAGIRVLEAIFVLGILGSAVVFILSAIDDLRDIFKSDVPGRETD